MCSTRPRGGERLRTFIEKLIAFSKAIFNVGHFYIFYIRLLL